MKIVLLGAPSSGKGTYAGMINKEYGVPHFSTGDMFRQLAEEGSELGIKAKEYWEKGLLVPDEITVKLVREMLSKPKYKNGFVMEGFPRTVAQAKALDGIAKVDKIINFEASEETLVDRASGRRICRKCGAIYHIRNLPPKKEGICDKCGGEIYQRDDDRPEIFKERLKVYRKQTKPMIDFYKDKGLLAEIDANGPPEEVFVDIKKVLDGLEE